MIKCEVCGKELIIPYKCKYCGGYFCVEHHLPEKHNCPGLVRGKWKYEPIRYREESFIIKPSFKPQSIYRKKLYFSRREIVNLLISIFLVGAIYISNYFFLIISYNRIALILSILIGSILAFILHELAHKFTAINYGLRAEYTTSKMGILLTAISIIPFLPIRIIAPGYVKIVSYKYDKNIYGKIALAGPLTNIILAILFILLSKIHYSLMLASLINIDIAFFNIMPFPILDGSHIIKWNIKIWILAMISTLLLWILCHTII